VILHRLRRRRRAYPRAALILVKLPQLAEELEAGALIVIEDGRVRATACRSFRRERVPAPRIPRGRIEKHRSQRTMAVTGNSL
jgi:hypothetical protein